NLIPFLTVSLDDLIQCSLAPVEDDECALTIYFGRDAGRRHAHLAEQLFNVLRLPLLHAHFRRAQGRWRLDRARALNIAEIAPHEMETVAQAARECVGAHAARAREPAAQKPTLAILNTPGATEAPSNPAALQKFQEAAEALGMRTAIIGKHDSRRLPEFDALFIRDNTNADHYTYQFARRAALAGIVVIDDPDSILKCNNKVYLAELLNRHRLPAPKTLLVSRENVGQIAPALGLPCVLKQPDSTFSLGVMKVESKEELETRADELLGKSELILAQEYLPTDFDWRIGILDRRLLFACKYFMVPGHWQVIQHGEREGFREGPTEAVPLGQVPEPILRAALEAANLIGDGFYGVDLKQRGRHCYIIEINDNPNVDADNEDGILKDVLYREVMAVFRKRIEARKRSIAS
ncbi:MAG TPA: RimK-like ATPgrasp N-terminal domain-containing protein, partial [Burkholderiaceae bacterium]|nr:RimK-like ATPgrasp N-terminal domain-containing protein [Burkholderiaceae bacterium]